MNTVLIEQVWAAVLTPVVGEGVLVLPGTNPANLDPQAILLIVDCEDCQHAAGEYWRALVRFVLSSPALREESALPVHTAAFDALSAWFSSPGNASGQFPRDGLALNGLFVNNCGNRREGYRWQGMIEAIIGHSTV